MDAPPPEEICADCKHLLFAVAMHRATYYEAAVLDKQKDYHAFLCRRTEKTLLAAQEALRTHLKLHTKL